MEPVFSRRDIVHTRAMLDRIATFCLAVACVSCGARSELIGPASGRSSPSSCPEGNATLVPQSQAVVIRANPQHVVYATASPGARLMRIAPDGSGSRELHTFGASSNQGAWALRGDSIVLNDDGRRLVHIDARTGRSRVIFASEARIDGWYFAMDDAFAYWGERDNRSGVEHVRRASLAGGAPQLLTELRFEWQYADVSANRNVEIVVVDRVVYWLHQPTIPRGGGSNGDGVVYRMPVDGGTPTAWISGLVEPRELARSADAVWVLEEGSSVGWGADDRVLGRGFDGAARAPIDFGLGPRDYSPAQVVVGNDAVFFVLGGSSDVFPLVRTGWWRRALVGGVAELVADARVGPAAILATRYEPACETLYVCTSTATVESDLVRYAVGR
jgi:hypothetical protein